MSKVGGEMLCYCGRCKLTLAHTVLAMVDGAVAQVRCNTCGNTHGNQRRKRDSGEGGTKSKPARSRRAGSISVDQCAYDAKLKSLAGKLPRNYLIAEKYELNDLIDHPQFGRGVIIRTEYPDKIEVMFPTLVRTLIHNHK